MTGTQGSRTISPRLLRIAELAKQRPQTALTTLAHAIDLDLLFEAYRRTRKDGAVGVDGRTAVAYAEHLEENLRALLERAKAGTYRAPPVRRVHIPKVDGSKTRPIGIPSFEDKVLQRAVAMVLEAVYEQDFRDCSFGFRPRRSAHQALQALWKGLMDLGGGWVLELDIQGFFDALDHEQLRKILGQRVRDGVLLRLIGKWLNAGVLEEGRLVYPDTGTPQGGVISPLLANVFLDTVLDAWFEDEVRPRLRGRSFLVRYADDAVMGFALEQDARRVYEVLAKRFARFGLLLHPEKTRLVRFERPSRSGSRPRPETFDFLGFTHYWGRSRRGTPAVLRKTQRARFSRALRAIAQWCSRHRHAPLAEQHRALQQKLRGHYAYYGITGNQPALSRFWWETQRTWKTWLSRRSNRRPLRWERFYLLIARYPLPPPRVVHSVYRLAAKP
jgi:group II intron reverse transcriptase/maturase